MCSRLINSWLIDPDGSYIIFLPFFTRTLADARSRVEGPRPLRETNGQNPPSLSWDRPTQAHPPGEAGPRLIPTDSAGPACVPLTGAPVPGLVAAPADMQELAVLPSAFIFLEGKADQLAVLGLPAALLANLPGPATAIALKAPIFFAGPPCQFIPSSFPTARRLVDGEVRHGTRLGVIGGILLFVLG